MTEHMESYDVLVIGGGPGGYPAAIRAAQKPLKTAIIENRSLGGTCLNRGCIPTKALIHNAHVLKQIQEASDFGIEVGSVSFSYPKMVERKDRVVSQVRRGLESLVKANRITHIHGKGRLLGPHEVEVETAEGKKIYHGKNIVLATGSEPKQVPAFPFDYQIIHNSTSILEMTHLPKKLVIIGGGVIGTEFASLFANLGTEVIIVEMLSKVLPQECNTISSFMHKVFTRRGVQILTGTKITKIEKQGAHAILHVEGDNSITADAVLVAVGRTMNTRGIGLEELGIEFNPDGTLVLDEYLRTKIPHIYAVGDIASPYWLAHVASHQGLVAAENISGIPVKMRYEAVPNVIFTDPEIASVGLTLEKALEKGYPASLSVFPFQALGKAQAEGQTEGFSQIVKDKETGQLLGAQIVGPGASNLIGEMALAIANELTIESVTETIHAHPTIAEAWLEAAMLASDAPLHMPPKRTLHER